MPKLRHSRGLPLEIINHIDLADMPSGTVGDHDARYYTQAQLNSTVAPSGSSLIGVEDAGGFFAGADVEAVLQELMVAILPGAYLRLDGTNVPIANYNWTTNLVTAGTLQGGTLTDGTFSMTGGVGTGLVSLTDGTASWAGSNLSGFGTIQANTSVTASTLTIAGGSITDTTGAISFGNEDLTTTGDINAGAGIFDITSAEALLVRKDGDTGDVFTIDTVNSSIGINAPPNIYYGIVVQKYSAGVAIAGIFGGTTCQKYTGTKAVTVVLIHGLNFTAEYYPSALLESSAAVDTLQAAHIVARSTSLANETKNIVITNMLGIQPRIDLTTGTNATGLITATKVYEFKTLNPYLTAGSGGSTPVITTLYGYYDEGMTAGATNWGFYGLSAQNYLSGSLDAGSYKVGGVAGFTGTGAYTNFTIVGGIITSAS